MNYGRQYREIGMLGAYASLVVNTPLDRLEVIKSSKPVGILSEESSLLTTSLSYESVDALKRETNILKDLETIVTRDNQRIVPIVYNWPIDGDGKPSHFFPMSIPAPPNVILHNLQEFNGRVYTLEQICKQTQFSSSEILRFAGELAHRYFTLYKEKRCIVNDIKPSNILLVLKEADSYSLEIPLILDLGSAVFDKRIKDSSCIGPAFAGRPFGTLAYMSYDELISYIVMINAGIPVIGSVRRDRIKEELHIAENDLRHILQKAAEFIRMKKEDPSLLHLSSASDVFSYAITLETAFRRHPYISEMKKLRVDLPDPWAALIAQESHFMKRKKGDSPFGINAQYPLLSYRLDNILGRHKTIPDFKKLNDAFLFDLKYQKFVKGSKYAAITALIAASALLAENHLEYINSSEYSQKSILEKYARTQVLDTGDISEFVSRLANEKAHFVKEFPQELLIRETVSGGDNYSFSSGSGPSFQDGYSLGYDIELYSLLKDSTLLKRINADLVIINSHGVASGYNIPYSLVYSKKLLANSDIKSIINPEQYENLLKNVENAVNNFKNTRYIGDSAQGFYALIPNYKISIKDNRRHTDVNGEYVFEPYAQFIPLALLEAGAYDSLKMNNNFEFISNNVLRFNGSTNENIHVDTLTFQPKEFFNLYSGPTVNYGLQSDEYYLSTNLVQHNILLRTILEWTKHDRKYVGAVTQMIDAQEKIFNDIGYLPEEVVYSISDTYCASPIDSILDKNLITIYTNKNGILIRANNLALLFFMDNLHEAMQTDIPIPNDLYKKVMTKILQEVNTNKEYPGLMESLYASTYNYDDKSDHWGNYLTLKVLREYIHFQKKGNKKF